jgi:hypothetical protein
MFRFQGSFLVNEHGKVMDISGNKDTENRNIQMYNKHGRINQQWDLVYVDEYPDEPTKGQLNKEFGFYVDRSFYIVSQLGEGRYLSMIDNRNLAIKTKNGRTDQQWYFHQYSKTVRCRANNRSFDIQNSGRSRNMQIWATNSGWW